MSMQLAGGNPVKWADLEKLFHLLQSTAGGAVGSEDSRCRVDGFICTALGGSRSRSERVEVREKI